MFGKSINGREIVTHLNSFPTRSHNYIITLATPEETLEAGRLSKQALELDGEELGGIQRLVLLNTLFALTPGILQYFMGDEYFSETPFYTYPSVLDVEEGMVGGSRHGLYNFTKSLLQFRLEKNVHLTRVIKRSSSRPTLQTCTLQARIQM